MIDGPFLTVTLRSMHVRDSFDCGNSLLNGYLHRQAGQDVKRRITACFVMADDNQVVKGYYTLSSAGIHRDKLPREIIKKLPGSYGDLPVTLLGRLAVDNTHRGKGLGGMLLIDALRRAHYTSVNHVASMAVVVDPIDEDAVRFYQKYGFILLPDSGKMFLPMNIIARLFV
jgi:GNAT superfamily N-acetyltransferase